MPLTAQRSYDITPGNDLADNAGFIPLSVLVDNYSPYWLLLQDAGRYVPPYTSGVVLPLIHADTNRATWTNPPLSGLSTQSYVSTAGFAHLTYVAEVLAYSAGSSVPNSALSQQQAYSVAEGGTLNVTLPFLAQGVRIDNPGGTCYTIIGTNLIIPPWTTAWLANFTTPFNNITIQPIANPNGTPNTIAGGPLVATVYAQQVTSNGGTSYISPNSGFSSNLISPTASFQLLAVLDTMTGQKQLNALSISNTPTPTTAINIYRLIGNATGPYKPIVMSPLNPGISQIFPGICKAYATSTIITGVLANSTTGTITITLPAFSTGDLLTIILWAVGDRTGTITPPSGWTQAAKSYLAGRNVTFTSWYRSAQNGDPSSIVFSGLGGTANGICVNCPSSSQTGAITFQDAGNGSNFAFSLTTAPSTPYISILILITDSNPGTVTWPSGYSPLYGPSSGTGGYYLSMSYNRNLTITPYTPGNVSTSFGVNAITAAVALADPGANTLYTKGALLYATPIITAPQLINLTSLGIIADVGQGIVIEASPASAYNCQLITN